MEALGNEKGKVSVWALSEKQADYLGSAECLQLAVKRDMKIRLCKSRFSDAWRKLQLWMML